VVSDIRHAWEADKVLFNGLFDSAGRIATRARSCIEDSHGEALGSLMDDNQVLLRQMGVSSPELEALIEAAHSAGALGAKLSGAGRGGNMIALVTPEVSHKVVAALEHAGAIRTIITEIGKP